MSAVRARRLFNTLNLMLFVVRSFVQSLILLVIQSVGWLVGLIVCLIVCLLLLAKRLLASDRLQFSKDYLIKISKFMVI